MNYIKNIIIVLVLVLFNFSLCFAESVETYIKNSLDKHFKSLAEYKILETIKEGEVYRVYLKGDGRIVPAYTNGEWVIIGSMFVNNVSLTSGELNRVCKQSFLDIRDELDEHTRFEYIPPKTSPTNEFIYLIYDANYKYCDEIRPKLKDICDKHGISLKIVLSSFFAPEPSDEIVRLFNSEAKFLDFISLNFEPKQNLDRGGAKKIKYATKILKDSGTLVRPAFIFSQTGETLHVTESQYLERYISSYFERGEESG